MKQVLVIDDSPVIRKIATRIVERMQLRTAEAEDGRKALSICSFSMPDAILLDCHMPIMDGFEFVRQLRKMPGGNQPKVIFFLVENDVGQIARAKHAGINGYILKPFDQQIVQSKFEELGIRPTSISCGEAC